VCVYDESKVSIQSLAILSVAVKGSIPSACVDISAIAYNIHVMPL